MLIALPTYWNHIAEEHVADYKRTLDRDKTEISIWASGFAENRCDPDKWPMLIQVCNVVKKIIDSREYNSTTLMDISKELDTVSKQADIPDSKTESVLFNINHRLRSVSLWAEHLEFIESYKPFYIQFSKKVLALWPYILSFALGLRLSKAIAAYKI